MMPIYDYHCSCGIEKKDEFVHSWDSLVLCSKCGNAMTREFPLQFVVDTFPKGGIFLKHVCPEGKIFHSKTEMKRYAKKHKLELGALL